MKVTLVGVRDVPAFQTRDGNVVDGVRIHFIYPDSDTYGNVAETKFIDRKVYGSFEFSFDDLVNHIGQVINLEFDPRKKVVGMSI